MPDWLSWGNVSSCRLLRRHVFRGSDMIGHRRRGRLVSRSGSCAGDVRENGRVLGNENGECESPAWIDLTTPW